jgi:hypothetical protein
MKFALDDAGKVQCEVSELIVSRLLVQANSGAGKSRTLRRILEQTHGAVQQIVIDTEGEFGSLREKYDYVYAAPKGGDTIAHPRSAALLAIRLLELRVSAIIDLYELPMHDRIRFVKLFFDAMIEAPKKLWHPVMVVLDEAHVFCPEKGKGQAESTAAVIDMSSRGRKRGFCAVYATQRIQKLSKDATADLNNKLIGRATQSADVERAADEIGLAKTQRRELVELEPGQFLVSGPAFNVKGIERVKVGRVRTTHPEAGKRIAFTAPPPTSKIRALLPKLSDLPAEAEAERKTLADLQAEIVRLKREVSQKQSGADPTLLRSLKQGLARAMKVLVQIHALDLSSSNGPTAEEIAAVMGLAGKNIEKLVTKRLEERGREIEKLRAAAFESMALVRKLLDEDVTVDVTVKPIGKPPKLAAVTRPVTRQTNDTNLGSGERQVLVAIAQHRDTGVSRDQVTVLTGFKRSTRDAYISRLRQKGLIGEEPFVATDDGLSVLGSSFEPLPTGDELRDHWLRKLPQGESAVLRVLVEAYPEPVSRDRVTNATGFKRSTRDAYLSRLSTRKLAIAHRGGMVAASPILFAEGGG